MRINRIILISLMAEKDISTIKLSELSGVARSTISGLRSGKSVRRETVEKIAAALNVDPEELRGVR